MSNTPQACTKQDLPALVALANRVFRQHGGDMGAEYPLVFGEENLEHCRIIKEGDHVVAHVGVAVRDAVILGARLRVASIGAVCTEAEARGKGYASQLMEDALRVARDEGAHLMLISGGRGLYHRLGYVTVGAFATFRASLRDQAGLRQGMGMSLCGSDDIADLAALYQHQAVRHVRPVSDWEKILNAGMLMNAAADCHGIWDDSHLVAYLATQRPRKNADGTTTPPRVMEYAGAETAVFEGLALLAASHPSGQVDVTAMPGSLDIPRLLRQAGAEEHETAFPGTLGIIDAEGFFAAIEGYLQERLGDLADRLSIHPLTTGGARFQLDREVYVADTMGRLTALVFGGSTEEARDIPSAPPKLGEVLARIFPMPLLWYGYNYV